ncbi:MAG: hypothetical protein J0665_01470 [Deltaproteobacteria bacterium]|nr:hypothetical protein [Deltaproteobacteria bacterium]
MISRALFMTLTRYFSVSIGVYVFILGGMYLIVDLLQVDKVTSYILVYLFAYLAEYAVTLTFVFCNEHHWLKVLKFIIHTAVFLVLSTLLFRAMLGWHVHYLIATFAVAVLLLPFRYLSNKYLVYR